MTLLKAKIIGRVPVVAPCFVCHERFTMVDFLAKNVVKDEHFRSHHRQCLTPPFDAEAFTINELNQTATGRKLLKLMLQEDSARAYSEMEDAAFARFKRSR
jgi:hypothetical protein